MAKSKIPKFYCYVDETGQDTKGELFIVSVIITEKEQQNLRDMLRFAEQESKKKSKKWIKTKKEVKQKYFNQIISNNFFRDRIFLVIYKQGKDYVERTLNAVTKVVFKMVGSKNRNYEVIIYVDGLSKAGRTKFATGLRQSNIKVKKVRGVRDESEIFIRLADAMAGFARDYLEKEKYAQDFCNRAVKRKIIQRVE